MAGGGGVRASTAVCAWAAGRERGAACSGEHARGRRRPGKARVACGGVARPRGWRRGVHSPTRRGAASAFTHAWGGVTRVHGRR